MEAKKMKNLFRRNKWRVHFVDKIGDSEKFVIIKARSMSQAKEKFRNTFDDKTIVRVILI